MPRKRRRPPVGCRRPRCRGRVRVLASPSSLEWPRPAARKRELCVKPMRRSMVGRVADRSAGNGQTASLGGQAPVGNVAQHDLRRLPGAVTRRSRVGGVVAADGRDQGGELLCHSPGSVGVSLEIRDDADAVGGGRQHRKPGGQGCHREFYLLGDLHPQVCDGLLLFI